MRRFALLLTLLLGLSATGQPRRLALTDGAAVTIESGGHRLGGTLFRPGGSGPHPAVVVINGSGPGTYRSDFEGTGFFLNDLTRWLLARGLAVLHVDKAGVGLSTGDWEQDDFYDRARYTLDAVAWLARQPGIDARRVGLVGHSEGGYVAYVAAARAPRDVAFVVTLAGPAVPVSEQVMDDLTQQWTCDDVRGKDARSWGMRAYLGLLRVVAPITKPTYLARVVRFDPAASITQMRQPLLALYAAHDPLVPPTASVERLRDYFPEGPLLRVRVVGGADHFFRAVESPCTPPEVHTLASAFVSALDDADFWRAVLSRP